MGGFCSKFLRGETDINDNGVADNKEVVVVLEKYLKKKDENNKKPVRHVRHKSIG